MSHGYFRDDRMARPVAGAAAGDLTPEDQFWTWAYRAAYGLFHLAALAGAVATGVTAGNLLLCLCCYLFAMAGVSVAYHRYFAHKAFRTSRAFQFVLALWGALAVEKGPLWWASAHRHHHRYADTPNDIHSPLHQGYLFAHSGWFLDRRIRNADPALCPEFARLPELVWLNQWNWVPVIVYAVLLTGLFGLDGLVWGFLVPTVLLWHMTHAIGSLLHSRLGYRRFPTPDSSRNSLLLAIPLLGEGFHNNHHFFPYAARCGLAWWEVDVSWWLIRMLEASGLIWRVRRPPAGLSDRHAAAGRAARQHDRWLADLRRALIAPIAALPVGNDPTRALHRDNTAGTLELHLDTLAADQHRLLIENPAGIEARLAAFEREVIAELQKDADADALSDQCDRIIRTAVANHPSRHLFATDESQPQVAYG